MRPGEIWVCNENCCFGVERQAPHYVKIVSIKNDEVEYGIIDPETGEFFGMLTNNLTKVSDTTLDSREEFIHYHDKLRDHF